MEVLRTPNERFENLARYPHVPKYVPVDPQNQLEMHFVDQGPQGFLVAAYAPDR